MDAIDDHAHPWIESARADARSTSTIVLFGMPSAATDPSTPMSFGWAAVTAADPAGTHELTALASVRGHAAALEVGALPELATAGRLLSSSRPSGPLPPPVLEAAVMFARLNELAVPLDCYDAACGRWHTRTLTERLEDLEEVRARDLGPAWRGWAETVWGPLKSAILAAHRTLLIGNAKAEALLERIDRGVRQGMSLDVVTPSNTARDALVAHLVEAGVPVPTDGSLVVRSLRQVQPWGPPRCSVLIGLPTRDKLRRVVGADVGPLNVLCWQHETRRLPALLQRALAEIPPDEKLLAALLPPTLTVAVPTVVPPAVIVSAVPAAPHVADAAPIRAGLLGGADLVALAALGVRVSPDLGPTSLPDIDDVDELNEALEGQGDASPSGPAPRRRFEVLAVGDGSRPCEVWLPLATLVMRVLGDRTQRLAVADIAPGMLLVGLDGCSPFDRFRSLLVQTRGPVTQMLLAAWDQALREALSLAGGPAELTRQMSSEGSTISSGAVAQWTDDDRIGPRDASDVARIGRLAGHPLVNHEAKAIAETMRRLRAVHQDIGRVLADPSRSRDEIRSRLEDALGPDAPDLLDQITVWRVLDADPVPTAASARVPDQPADNDFRRKRETT
ncbi:hypothetical protein [Pseudofrankia sp. BMG5.37]|uniref:DISARM anti-phage system protein DrmE domain-containing protein n=1 Tax=Pseudofrankia sp. BMG5.37 TaxID=3050035 RepID=UPI00289436C8|nr:hypothetical protein [Pseudofrankia sp. BMG5.37]MDT3438735.1 hypothetical protein [Pseudofrankia sp. BMG5.37]